MIKPSEINGHMITLVIVTLIRRSDAKGHTIEQSIRRPDAKGHTIEQSIRRPDAKGHTIEQSI
ncbi:MAG: hypothetical protein KDJ52_26860, partial [Anaerolineae bacterium]|nr:hypothetical protein [Anaerolineae bacterium]